MAGGRRAGRAGRSRLSWSVRWSPWSLSYAARPRPHPGRDRDFRSLRGRCARDRRRQARRGSFSRRAPEDGSQRRGVGRDEQREALGTLTAGRSVEGLRRAGARRRAPDEAVRRAARGRRRLVQRRRRRGVRLPRPERRRQDHDRAACSRTLIAPTSGSAARRRAPARPANGVEIRQRIAVMPEKPGLYLRLTRGREPRVLRRPVRARRAGGADRRRRWRRSTSPTGPTIPAAASRRASASGSRSPARCSATRRSLFLDEPTSGLDPVASREVHELIDGLRERGVTVFLTTHRLEEAERLCDRVAILNTTPAHDRPAGRAARPAVHEDAASSGPARRSPRRTRCSPSPASTAGAPTTTARYVADRQRRRRVAAPAVTRALVAAGADVLSIAEARHSLEDVYLELDRRRREAAPMSARAGSGRSCARSCASSGATASSSGRWRCSRSSS